MAALWDSPAGTCSQVGCEKSPSLHTRSLSAQDPLSSSNYHSLPSPLLSHFHTPYRCLPPPTPFLPILITPPSIFSLPLADASSLVGAEMVDASTGKPAGKVVAALGGRGLGLMRLSAALSEGAQLQVKGEAGGEAVEVRATRPTWWPPEWGNEE